MSIIQGISPYSSDYDIRRDVATRILIKDTWDGTWRTVDYLVALSAEAMVAPGIGRATLNYRYGKILNAGETSWRNLEPQELVGKLVQIRTVGNSGNSSKTLWTGVITSETERLDGSDVGVISGEQNIIAYEAGHIVDRHALEGAYFEESSGVAAVINNLPDFNRPGRFGFFVLGNRSLAKIGGCYVFSGDNSVWTNYDIVEYLLTCHAPPGFTFRITGQPEPLAQIVDIHRLEGMSLWGALDSLVDRHRGLGWNLITQDDGVFDFNVFTLLDEPIGVGDAITPANENKIDNLQVASDRGASATITQTEDSQYDRVTVLGDYVKTCFSVSIADGTIEEAWTSTEETAYKTAVSTDNAENDAERQTDKNMRVYQAFRIPTDWDGMVGANVAVPSVRDDGTLDVSTVAKSFLANKSLDRALPIKSAAAVTGADPDYLSPIVAFENPTRANRYEQTETVGATLKVADSELGFSVQPKINHILGFNHFDAVTDGSEIEPIYDWETLVATISFDTDERLRVRAKCENFENIEEPKTLKIFVPDATIWYMVPGTITGVTDGALVTNSTGGTLRDDSARLRQIAVLALAWYSNPRATIDITWRRITNPAVLGAMIQSVSNDYTRRISGTVVSSIEWNFVRQTTNLKTSFADIQFQKFITKKHDLIRLRNMLHMEKYLGNLPSRFKAGGGTTVSGDTTIWNEDTGAASA